MAGVTQKGPIYAVLAAALFGASTPFSKVLVGEMDPILLAALLYLGAGAGLFLLGKGLRPTRAPAQEASLGRSDYPWLLGGILTGGVLAPISLLAGLQLTPAATAALLLNFELVATALLAAVVFSESVGTRALAAVAVIAGAGVVLTWHGAASGFTPGALGVIAACILWGIDNNLTRKISGKNPLTIAVAKGLGAGGISLALAMIVRAPFPGFGPAAAALAVGFVTYGLSILFFVLALRDLGAARTSAYFASAPFIGAIASLLFFREVPGMQFLVALPLFLVGIFLLLGERHAHRHLHERLVHTHRHRRDEHHAHAHPGEDTGEHVHEHVHEPVEHEHTHTPDLHHRHGR